MPSYTNYDELHKYMIPQSKATKAMVFQPVLRYNNVERKNKIFRE